MRILFSLISFLLPGTASAFCGTYVGSPGVELVNQTSQVILSRQDSRTTLTLANDYQGLAKEFAMLIPVPKVLEEDEIRTVRPELFQRFDNYSAPRVVRYECDDFYWEDADSDSDSDSDSDADADADADTPPDVVVEAEYQVGIYDVVILSAEESGALLVWLDSNGYGLSPDAESILADYIESGSYFFAAKVNLEDVAEEVSFLEPLQFEYDSDAFALPVRLGTINSPGEQDVVMYILNDEDDGKAGISNYPQVTIEDECMVNIYGAGGADTYYGGLFADAWAAEEGAGWIVEYAWSPSSCDPCSTEPPTSEEFEEAGFNGDPWDAYFTRLRIRYTPEAATQDINLYTSGIIENEQIRFIDYNIQMEDRFPVCGEGMLDDPGSCDEDGYDDGGPDDGGPDGGSDVYEDCTDTDDGATDRDGDSCAEYSDFPEWCEDDFDDADFNAAKMCCACGGGQRPDSSDAWDGKTSGSESSSGCSVTERRAPLVGLVFLAGLMVSIRRRQSAI